MDDAAAAAAAAAAAVVVVVVVAAGAAATVAALAPEFIKPRPLCPATKTALALACCKPLLFGKPLGLTEELGGWFWQKPGQRHRPPFGATLAASCSDVKCEIAATGTAL